MWANSESRDPSAAERLSAWLASEVRLEPRLPADSGGDETVASVVASERFDRGFTTRVVVTIEVVDADSGLTHLQALDLVLEPTDDSWIVTSLELAR